MCIRNPEQSFDVYLDSVTSVLAAFFLSNIRWTIICNYFSLLNVLIMVSIPLLLIFSNTPIRFLVGKAWCEISIWNRNNREELL